ncbi:hypothetical protein BX600DRAFT_192276 [Xylariales sp. PMI_506]|nr:hypothetical protein BX600DRAFT_192276 [Xylariales sp. PMI_506]
MQFSTLLVGVFAEMTLASYSIPLKLAAANDECILPAQFTITEFATFGDKFNGTMNSTSFHYSDTDTNIDTDCYQNASSVGIVPVTGGTTRYPCGDANVQFIYSMGKLTLIEIACPDSGSSPGEYEASGTAKLPALECMPISDGTMCIGAGSATSNFTTLDPVE